MSTNAHEFDDLMPHVIKVYKNAGANDYGKETADPNTIRQYRCLVDDSTTTVRNAGGQEVTVALTIYVWPIPIGSAAELPVDIEDNEIVEVITPRPQTRTLVGIERHYDSVDGVGYLHNITLRFS